MRHDIDNPFARASAHWTRPKLKSLPLTPDEVSNIVNAQDPGAALVVICRERGLIAGEGQAGR